MRKVSILVTICATLAAFAAGFSFANYLNRSRMTAAPAAQTGSQPSTPNSDAQQSILSDEEINSKIEESEADPSNFAFQKGLGIGLYRYGAMRQDKALIEKAIPVLVRANKLNGDDVDVLTALGNAHFDVGYFGKENSSLETARGFYAKALTKRPSDVEIRTDVGLTYFLMTPPEHAAAIAEFEKSLAIDPKHEKTLGLVIQSLDALGRDSSRYKETLRSINPKNPALNDIGVAK